eukprot:SAG11_NODE_22731_length_401_cov_0.688742_1_plen_85_part_10
MRRDADCSPLTTEPYDYAEGQGALKTSLDDFQKSIVATQQLCMQAPSVVGDPFIDDAMPILRPRRNTAARVNYAEPKANRKLTQG